MDTPSFVDSFKDQVGIISSFQLDFSARTLTLQYNQKGTAQEKSVSLDLIKRINFIQRSPGVNILGARNDTKGPNIYLYIKDEALLKQLYVQLQTTPEKLDILLKWESKPITI